MDVLSQWSLWSGIGLLALFALFSACRARRTQEDQEDRTEAGGNTGLCAVLLAVWVSLGVASCLWSWQVGLMVLVFLLLLTFIPPGAWWICRRVDPKAMSHTGHRCHLPASPGVRPWDTRWPVILVSLSVALFVLAGLLFLWTPWWSYAVLGVCTLLFVSYHVWWWRLPGSGLWFPSDKRPAGPTLQEDMSKAAGTYYFFAPLAWILTSLPLYLFPLEMIARRYHRHSRADVCVSPRGLHCHGPYHPLDVDLNIVLRLCFHFWLLIGVDVLVPGEERHLWATVVLALVLAYEMLTHTLSALLRAPSRTARPLLLSLSGYAEAITLFAIAYRAMSLINSAHFGFAGKAGVRLCAWQAWRLSAVTMTTLGYGRYYPVSGAASIICSIESIVGVVFIAVLVGGFVSILRGRKDTT